MKCPNCGNSSEDQMAFIGDGGFSKEIIYCYACESRFIDHSGNERADEIARMRISNEERERLSEAIGLMEDVEGLIEDLDTDCESLAASLVYELKKLHERKSRIEPST